MIGSGDYGGLVNGVNGNQVGVVEPGLDFLVDNGGPTQTIALSPGSPAIGAGSNALAVDDKGNPLTTDQRGTRFPRIVGSAVDIGAYEVQATERLVVTAQPPGASRQDWSLPCRPRSKTALVVWTPHSTAPSP